MRNSRLFTATLLLALLSLAHGMTKCRVKQDRETNANFVKLTCMCPSKTNVTLINAALEVRYPQTSAAESCLKTKDGTKKSPMMLLKRLCRKGNKTWKMARITAKIKPACLMCKKDVVPDKHKLYVCKAKGDMSMQPMGMEDDKCIPSLLNVNQRSRKCDCNKGGKFVFRYSFGGNFPDKSKNDVDKCTGINPPPNMCSLEYMYSRQLHRFNECCVAHGGELKPRATKGHVCVKRKYMGDYRTDFPTTRDVDSCTTRPVTTLNKKLYPGGDNSAKFAVVENKCAGNSTLSQTYSFMYKQTEINGNKFIKCVNNELNNIGKKPWHGSVRSALKKCCSEDTPGRSKLVKHATLLPICRKPNGTEKEFKEDTNRKGKMVILTPSDNQQCKALVTTVSQIPGRTFLEASCLCNPGKDLSRVSPLVVDKSIDKCKSVFETCVRNKLKGLNCAQIFSKWNEEVSRMSGTCCTGLKSQCSSDQVKTGKLKFERKKFIFGTTKLAWNTCFLA